MAVQQRDGHTDWFCAPRIEPQISQLREALSKAADVFIEEVFECEECRTRGPRTFSRTARTATWLERFRYDDSVMAAYLWM